MAKTAREITKLRANAKYLRLDGAISRLSVRLYPQTRMREFLSILNYSAKTKTQHATMTGNEDLSLVIPMKVGYLRLLKRL